MSFLKDIPASLILFYTIIMIWSKMLDKKIDYKNYKFYVTLIVLAAISVINFYFVNDFIKIIIISIVMAIGCYFLFDCRIKESVLTIIISQIIFMISDCLVAITLTLIFNLDTYTANLQISPIIINTTASVFAIVIYKLFFMKKLYKFLLDKTKGIKNFEITIFCLIIIIFTNLFAMLTYNQVDFRIAIIVNTIFTIFCLSLAVYSFKTKNNYNKVYDKYNTTLNSLKEYEDILDKYRISNHENKNELLTIRNMLPKINKKIISYIDSIVDNKIKDDEKIMYEVSKIPAGGLRGLIYSKILTMKQSKINYDLEISNEIKTVDLINMDDSLMLDICKVIGVYLDNSVQAVQNLKNKHINIEIYLDGCNLNISVSNNYEGIIEIDKLEQKGYSSKGKNHGYGLALTKEIIDNNKNLLNEKRLSKEVFSQILKIKM